MRLNTIMNAEPGADSMLFYFLQRTAKVSVWLGLLAVGFVSGWYGAYPLLLSVPGLWHVSGRSCPEGWLGICSGVSLFCCAIAFHKRLGAYIVATVCGFGLGFGSMSGFYFLITKCMPAC
jgi:hypothetical protein